MLRGSGKLPGKTKYSGRRRPTTRKSGFHSHPDSTGGEWKTEDVDLWPLQAGPLRLCFNIPPAQKGDFLGFGLWYLIHGSVTMEIANAPKKFIHTSYPEGIWNKLGSFWISKEDIAQYEITVIFKAQPGANAAVAIYDPSCGIVQHERLAEIVKGRAHLLNNQHTFAPETNFYTDDRRGSVRLDIQTKIKPVGLIEIYLKSCNRCARFLPINCPGDKERYHLSFTNHCVASHRRPCSHAGFGRLRHVDTGEELQLEYGFQLECRFCKKFEVNAAHNPKRTAAQMKEDAARRRAFELLLEELYKGTPQLRYRHEHGSELADDVWERFGGHCFKCGTKLKSKKSMHLDHTRPLKLLWPLDGSATALCASYNSEKRDRAPVEFYNEEQLRRLSNITGLSLGELQDPRPNEDALRLLFEQQDWFFEHFLKRPEMTKVRDGKVAGELVVKALQKVVELSSFAGKLDLMAEYERRRHQKSFINK